MFLQNNISFQLRGYGGNKTHTAQLANRKKRLKTAHTRGKILDKEYEVKSSRTYTTRKSRERCGIRVYTRHMHQQCPKQES
jgi:hypothetical protein